MPQSLDSVILHLVFSTKKRVPFLNGGIRDEVHRYLGTQEEHHRTVSFQDEFRALLAKHEMAWDEAYVWD